MSSVAATISLPGNNNPKYLWSTSDGRVFEGPTALATHIGVSTGAVCNAAKEAQQRESDSFLCGGQACFRRQLIMESPQDPDSNNIGFMCIPYILSLMPVMQAHAHMQAAAHRLYPKRKLKIPTLSNHQIQSIRVWIPKSADSKETLPKFDLAQIWSLHSPSSYCSQYGFRRALLGEPQEKPVPELRKYPSLSFFAHEQLSKPSVAMHAEDIIKFMLSDFARKGQFDEIFEVAQAEVVQSTELPVSTASDIASDTLHITNLCIRKPAASTTTPPPSPCSEFSLASLMRMRELESNMSMSIAGDAEAHANKSCAKRRRLIAAREITRLLFDANKLLLDANFEQ